MSGPPDNQGTAMAVMHEVDCLGESDITDSSTCALSQSIRLAARKVRRKNVITRQAERRAGSFNETVSNLTRFSYSALGGGLVWSN
jgi:hypothetical protein